MADKNGALIRSCVKVLGLVAALTVGMSGFEAHAAPTVSLGANSAAVLQGAVRYRNFRQFSNDLEEIQVGDGVADGLVTNPITGQLTWNDATVTITYTNSTLTTVVKSEF